MNPVSTRGRSMPRDRRAFRALCATTGFVCLSVTTGCLKPTLLRPNDDPRPPNPHHHHPSRLPGLRRSRRLHPARDKFAICSAIRSVQPWRFRPKLRQQLLRRLRRVSLRAGMPPQQLESASDSTGPQPDALAPVITEPVSETPVANPTPLLDAAIERVAAITRHDESADSGTAALPSKGELPQANPTGPPSGASIAAPLPQPQAPQPADALAPKPENATSVVKQNDAPAPMDVSVVPKLEPPSVRVETQPKSASVAMSGSDLPTKDTPAKSDERTHPAIDVTRPQPVPVEADPLGIDKLTLCRKVLGFGSFESLADSRVKAGQRLLVYCEMTGMQYEEKHSEFVSRLSSRIEITSVTSGMIVWKHELGPAEDVCGSRRRDFYVNYRVDLPSSLPTGLYSLRLTQHDLVAQRSTSAEIPLEIIP